MPAFSPSVPEIDVVAALPHAIAYLDAGYRCVYLNPAWSRLTGYPGDAFQNRSLLDVVHEDDAEQVRHRLNALTAGAFAHEAAPVHLPIRIVRQDGSLRYAEVTAQPIGEAGQTLVMLYDVTTHAAERRELQAKHDAAEEAIRSRASFLALLNHKLRTPLAGIMSMASLMSIKLPESFQDYAASIERSGQSLLAMLNALVAHARLESGDPVNLQRIRLIDVVEMLTYEARAKAEARGLELVVTASADARAARLRTEPNALELVLHNLLDNAIDNTTTGRITVALEADAETATIRIADTGPGIDADLLDAVTSPGFPTTPKARKALSGRGVGLVLVYQFTALMGGTITLESTPEAGTTFALTFPRDDAAG